MLKQSKLFCVVLVVTVSMMTGFAAFAQTFEDDVFGVVKVADPEGFFAGLGQFVDKVQPGTGAMVGGMVTGQLQMILNNPEWLGMDKTGMFTLVVLNPMKYPQSPVALVVPVTDSDAYINTLTQNLQGGTETEGVYEFMQMSQRPMFVTFTEDSGVLTENNMIANQVKAALEAGSPVFTEDVTVKGDLVLSLAMDKIMAATRPMLDGLKEQMLMEMASPAAEGETVPPEATQNILREEINAFLSLLGQSQEVQIGLGVEDEGLRLAKVVMPAADSALADFFDSQAPETSDLLGLMPADAGIVMSASVNLTPELVDAYLNFAKAMSAISPDSDPAAFEKMEELVRKSADAFGGDLVVGALSTSQDALFTEVFSLADVEKAKALFEEYPETIQAMSGFYQKMGMDFGMELTEKAEVSGGEIMDFALNFDMEQFAADPEAQEMFEVLFGETASMPIGVVGDYGVVGFGKDARSSVEALMAQVDSGAETAANYAPAAFGLPEENNIFMYLSVSNIFKWATKIVPEEVPEVDIQTGPGVGMSGRFIDGLFEGELYVPLQEILAIKNFVEQAQAAEMEQ